MVEAVVEAVVEEDGSGGTVEHSHRACVEHKSPPTLTKSSFSTASTMFVPGTVAVILIESLPMARGRILNVKLLLESAWTGSGPGSRPRSDRSSWRSIARVTWIERYTQQYIQYSTLVHWTGRTSTKASVLHCTH